MTPRCGRPMRLFEAVWGALPDGLWCGRPEGHDGACRSVQSVAARAEREGRTWAVRSAARRERARQAARRAVLAEAATAGYRAGWDKRRAGERSRAA